MDADSFATDGYAIAPGVLSEPECDLAGGQIRLADPGAGGTRCLLSQAWCATLAARLRMRLDDTGGLRCAYPPYAFRTRLTHQAVTHIWRNWSA